MPARALHIAFFIFLNGNDDDGLDRKRRCMVVGTGGNRKASVGEATIIQSAKLPQKMDHLAIKAARAYSKIPRFAIAEQEIRKSLLYGLECAQQLLEGELENSNSNLNIALARRAARRQVDC